MNKKRNLMCSNELIENVKKHNSVELKVFYNLLYAYKTATFRHSTFLEEEEEDDVEIEYPVYQIQDYLGKKHLSLRDIKQIILDMPKIIYNKDKLGFISVFDTLNFEEDTGIIRFTLANTFKHHVGDLLQNFTMLELSQLSNLSSVYSQRLFEFISKNRNIGTYKMPVDEFKNFFDISPTYTMGNIGQKILDPAIRDINDLTDFNVSVKKIKVGNKITHFLFAIKAKTKSETEPAKEEEKETFESKYKAYKEKLSAYGSEVIPFD